MLPFEATSENAGPFVGHAATQRSEHHVEGHVPKVHVTYDNVSHPASMLPDEAAQPRVIEEILSKAMPAPVRKQATESMRTLRERAGHLVDEVVAHTKTQAEGFPAPEPTTSNARPSGRRPLRDDERSGLWLLAGIVAGGFMLGGWAAPLPQGDDKRRAALARSAPHFEHGGGIVGNGPRKC